ncbi:hypothetical protein NUW54_g9851 [Trametes sanguinea]|uniref:Uncharacterized protein n=1 Tax=Trametes sanguinea TaxID=158606 RepID=A0ACC1P4E8_9APHY|nr:hypothetical protein NUW54_g9851 [Trametes sanguinea]
MGTLQPALVSATPAHHKGYLGSMLARLGSPASSVHCAKLTWTPLGALGYVLAARQQRSCFKLIALLRGTKA